MSKYVYYGFVSYLIFTLFLVLMVSYVGKAKADSPGLVNTSKTTATCAVQKPKTAKKMVTVKKQDTVAAKKEEKIIRSEVKVETKMPKNQLILGLRHDIVSLSAKSERVGLVQKASVQAEEGAVLSLKYIRNGILSDNVGIGLGADTNGVVEGLVGFGF